MSDEQLRALAESQVAQTEATQHIQGQLSVIVCALGALVQSHPAPGNFASSFLTIWSELESLFLQGTFEPSTEDGMDAVLSILEGALGTSLRSQPKH